MRRNYPCIFAAIARNTWLPVPCSSPLSSSASASSLLTVTLTKLPLNLNHSLGLRTPRNQSVLANAYLNKFSINEKGNLNNDDGPRVWYSDCTRAKEERLSRYDFWEERYKKAKTSTTFDWFLDPVQLLENIDTHLKALNKNVSNSTVRYLELGCGNSDLPRSVYTESSIPVFVFALDYVTHAAQQQTYRAKNVSPKNKKSQFQAICGDVLKLPLKSQMFDIAIDKGTMDALLKNKENGVENSCVMLSEVMRTLVPGGRFLQISDEDPDSRLEFLQRLSRRSESIVEYNKYNNKSNNIDSLGNNCGKFDLEVTNGMKNTDHDKDSDLQLYGFQDFREEVKLNIVQNETCRSEKPLKADKVGLTYSSWNFKVISDDGCNKEYFMYWIEKT